MEIPKGSTLYFDANIFRSVNDDECSELQELAATKNVKCCCPPRVFIELCSHINSDEKDKFKHYQTFFRRQKKICSSCILPYRQTILADYFGLNRPLLHTTTPLEDWIESCDQIIDSNGYDELDRRLIRAVDLESGQELSLNHWYDFRATYEKMWVNLICSGVNEAKNKIPNDATSREIREALYSLESKRLFLNEMIKEVGGECPNELSPSQVDELLKPMEANFSFLMKIFEVCITGPYGRDKLKNDYNDLELLLYLGLKDHFFITNDKTLRNKVDDSCEQKKRILTFDEAVCELQR